MAQTGFTPIQLYSTSTAAATPAAGNLTNSTLGSELAINITDGKLFYKDNANAVQVIGWKTVPTTAGGTGLTTYTAGDLSYYASGTALTKLAIGASTTILTSTGSAPQWSATSGITVGTATNLAGGLAGSVPYQTGAGATTFLGIGASGRYLSSTGSAPQWSVPAALTKTDDTNVTLTLGGSASTALLNAASLTLGWTGQLAVSRGGTGISSFGTGVATALGQNVTGSGGIVLETNPSFTSSVGSSIGTNSRTINLVSTATAGVGVGPAISFSGNTGNSTSPYGFGGIQGVKESAVANNYAGSLIFYTQNGGGASAYTENARMLSNGDFSVTNGNVIIATSGKGIDFSATPGTGTSELLADYEEGTWTATLTNISGGTVTNTNYVKVGNMVTARLSISGGTYTANSSFFSLPFACVALTSGTFSNATIRGGFLEAQASSSCYFSTSDSGNVHCSITYITS